MAERVQIMSIFRGTTPTYTLTFDDDNLDFGDANNIVVSIGNKSKTSLLELSGEDLTVEERQISFSLSQEQTLALPNSDLLVQVNWTYLSGTEVKRAASNQVTINFSKNLKEEVME